MAMELVQDFVLNQFYIPVAIVTLVVVGIILVFALGFKSPEQPPFNKLTSGAIDDRKPASKKKKSKEKKTVGNGFVPVVTDSKVEKSPAKSKESKSSAPEKDVVSKEKKQESNVNQQSNKNVPNNKVKKSPFEIVEEIKNKKNKKQFNEKPLDYDDGSWEKVPTKLDKKNKIKVQDSPVKKEKKPKEKKAPIEIPAEKAAKEEVNKELQEKQKQKEKKKEKKIEEEIKKEKKIEEEIKPVKEDPAPVKIEEVLQVVEEVKNKKKDKKQKANKNLANEQPPVTETPVIVAPKEAVAPQKIAKESNKASTPPPSKKGNNKIENVAANTTSASAPAFDELGDVWTEAKAAKKSKKKARKDN